MERTNGCTGKDYEAADDSEGMSTIEIKDERDGHILYHVSDVPPIPATIVFALQVFLVPSSKPCLTVQFMSCEMSLLNEHFIRTNMTETNPTVNLVCGVLMTVSVFHALVGATGLGGQILRIIGPLTVASSGVVMILKVAEALIKFVIIHLGIAFFTLATLLILTTFMVNVQVPLLYWKRGQGWKTTRSRFLRTYAVLISIGLGWLLCHVLTVTGRLPEDPDDIQFHARTDSKADTVELASWFYFPYPGQFGTPRFSLTLFFGLLVAMISSIIDSLADYNIVTRICQIPRPPAHATNRGLLIEGSCSILSGAFGAGLATSTHISVTGSLAISGVTSRRVFQCAGLLLIFLGVVGKIGAFLVIIPKPVIGGVMLVILGSVVGVLLAELNQYEMKRPRNCMTVGLSILVGYMIPQLIIRNPDRINTGIPELNNVIRAMFGAPLFVAGVVACFLDNTLPGDPGRKPDLQDGEPITSGERALAVQLGTQTDGVGQLWSAVSHSEGKELSTSVFSYNALQVGHQTDGATGGHCHLRKPFQARHFRIKVQSMTPPEFSGFATS
ncbi:solute carrier family 23 member 1-like [Liolophura sinensis]|uniref:solute carrier family 23 member 1-like n=1 Tax=Liolophura sinensis TaxID=3198878 RepID=UPI0031597F0A